MKPMYMLITILVVGFLCSCKSTSVSAECTPDQRLFISLENARSAFNSSQITTEEYAELKKIIIKKYENEADLPE